MEQTSYFQQKTLSWVPMFVSLNGKLQKWLQSMWWVLRFRLKLFDNPILLFVYTSERDSKKGYCILRAHLQMGIDIIWRCGGGCGVIYRWKNIIMLMCINARVSEYLSETELLHACSSVWTSEKLRGGKQWLRWGFSFGHQIVNYYLFFWLYSTVMSTIQLKFETLQSQA